jgi:hypothetical protein
MLRIDPAGNVSNASRVSASPFTLRRHLPALEPSCCLPGCRAGW